MPAQPRGHETRHRLLAAAAHDVDRGGSASLNTICQKAGVSRGALTHHFASKADLLNALRQEAQQRLCPLLRRFLADRRPLPEALRECVTQYFAQLAGDHIVRAGRLLAARERDPASQRQLVNLLQRRLAHARGASPGDTLPQAMLIMSVLTGLETLGRHDRQWWHWAASPDLWHRLGLHLDAHPASWDDLHGHHPPHPRALPQQACPSPPPSPAPSRGP
ncbi:TetR family transcriptional regulator [Streptomyces sp. NPDC057702]|uniref:TetR family transcriptional regulator n=1 Tax=unclassified Streptomyces TaxID=2593676 RepID=UPI00367FAA83